MKLGRLPVDTQPNPSLRVLPPDLAPVRTQHSIGEQNLEQPLSNKRLAKVAIMSESRFIRRFREATGRTPGRFVQDRRLHHAAELLVSTDQSIDQIAESCGFANRYYFTRVFAQRMGCPPARYRTDTPYLGKPRSLAS